MTAAWAVWCATLSFRVKNTAAGFLEECVHVSRLFWLPDQVVREMRRMGLNTLLGAGIARARVLDSALTAIR